LGFLKFLTIGAVKDELPNFVENLKLRPRYGYLSFQDGGCRHLGFL